MNINTLGSNNWLGQQSMPAYHNENKLEGENTFDKTALNYSRRITATVSTESLGAKQMVTSTGTESVYSYEATTQRFDIFIDVKGGEKTYRVEGTDKDGNPFSDEFDPYDVDLEKATFPQFAAICNYVQETDGLADRIMSGMGTPDDILESRNYISVMGSWTMDQLDNGNVDLFSDCMKLLDKIHEFMKKQNALMEKGNSYFGFQFASVSKRLAYEDLNDLFRTDKEDEIGEKSLLQHVSAISEDGDYSSILSDLLPEKLIEDLLKVDPAGDILLEETEETENNTNRDEVQGQEIQKEETEETIEAPESEEIQEIEEV